MITEAEIPAHIRPIEGKVIVTFAREVSWLSLDPDSARAFAQLILNCAVAIEASKQSP